MKHTDAIRLLLEKNNMSQADLAKQLGLPGRKYVNDRASYPNINVKRLIQTVDPLNYEVVLQPKVKGERPEGQFVLTLKDYE